MNPTLDVMLVDPIPRIHCRYEDEICATLAEVGCSSAALVGQSAEVGTTGFVSRVAVTIDLLRRPGRLRRLQFEHIYVCWPIFGLLEPLLWMRTARRSRVTIVIHDPTPLRRTHGVGRIAARLGRYAASSGRVQVAVHSRPASDALIAYGWRKPELLPHPILLSVDVRPPPSDRTLVVVGQYKPARDLSLLRELAEPLRKLGYDLVIAGRGWPDIPGWAVQDRYLSEQELDEIVSQAACVLIPYRDFYQSGIAVRALEAGRAVVGPEHPFLASLYGADWPGFARTGHTESWIDAISAAVSVPLSDVCRRQADYVAHVRARWTDYFSC